MKKDRGLTKYFKGPIPGESLTRQPKQFAWERPPEIVEPEKAMRYYLDKLHTAEAMRPIMDAVEMGVPIKKLVDGILRVGVSEGLHTIDVSVLVAPAIHEAVRSTAEDLGIPYEEGLIDKEKEAKYEKTVGKAKLAQKMKKWRKEMKEDEQIKKMIPSEGPVMEEQPELPMEMPRKGLMAREEE